MSQMITDLSLHALAEANEANWREGWRAMFERWDRGEVHSDSTMTWYRSDVAHPLMNGVLNCRFAPEEAADEVTRMIDRFRERNLDFWWWTYPTSAPADLGALLEGRGLVREADLPGMGVDLAILPAEVALPDGVTVERVTTPEGIAQWAEAYETGFPMAKLAVDAHVEIFTQVGLDSQDGWRHYVGLDRGRPVGSSSLYLGAGVAGLYYVSTVPAARGRGIGKAMVLTPLLEARAMGYRAGILQATEMGRPIYRKLGFQDCITYPQYRWRG